MNNQVISIWLPSIIDFCICVGGYLLFRASKKLLREIRKLIGIINITKSANIITDLQKLSIINQTLLKPFVFIKGTSEKIFNRDTSYIHKDIILSYSNSNYLEDFFLNLKKGKVLIQPHPKMQHFNLENSYLKNDSGIFSSLFRYLFNSESPVVRSGDEFMVYGRIKNNKDYVLKDQEMYLNIKPVFIERGGDISSFCISVRSMQITKTFLALTSFLMISGGLLFYYSIFYKKKIKHSNMKRNRVYCLKCNINPCNILCEKCDYLNEYCSDCFKNFQNEINDDNLLLKDLKCCFCKEVLNIAQLLITN